MGYDRNDRGSWRGSNESDHGRRDYGRGGDQGRGYGRQPQGYDYEERGFFDRAGDEVRSWFGDDEAERRRRMDERFDDRNRGDERGYGAARFGGDRESGSTRAYGSDRGYGTRGYGSGDEQRGDRGVQRGSAWDRSSDDDRSGAGSSSYGRQSSGFGNDHPHDTHYRNWRDRQMESFDRDYADYRHENQGRFESEFGAWRTQREGQRSQLARVKEHAEVVGSDGQHVGTVDHVQGDQIKLARNDKDAGGQHHFVPLSWIQSVDDKVTLSKSAAEAKQHWTDEARNAGSSLFGRDDRDPPDQGGSRNLNRSFSGTY